MKKRRTIKAMVGSMLLNNIYSIVAGFIIISLLGGIISTSLYWIVYVIALLPFFVFIYHEAWNCGSEDCVCNAEKTSFKGEIIGLIASVPTLVLSVLSIMVSQGVFTSKILVFGQSLSVVLYHVWNVSFSILFDYLNTYPLLHFVPAVAMILACALGYRLGHRQIKISDYMYYAREKDE